MRLFKYTAISPLALMLVMTLQGCWEAPPMESEQVGFRGVAMWQTTNPDVTDPLEALNQVPEVIPASVVVELSLIHI